METNGGVTDSHSSVMDRITDFLEDGEALEGTNKDMLNRHALTVLDQAEEAAQKRLQSFLSSTSPSFPFPTPFLAADALARHVLRQKQGYLDTLVELRGFNPGIVDGTKRDAGRAKPGSPKGDSLTL